MNTLPGIIQRSLERTAARQVPVAPARSYDAEKARQWWLEAIAEGIDLPTEEECLAVADQALAAIEAARGPLPVHDVECDTCGWDFPAYAIDGGCCAGCRQADLEAEARYDERRHG